MGKIIFLFFLCYNCVFSEKYIVIRIPDGNSINETIPIRPLPFPIQPLTFPILNSTQNLKKLAGDYKSKSVSIFLSPNLHARVWFTLQVRDRIKGFKHVCAAYASQAIFFHKDTYLELSRI